MMLIGLIERVAIFYYWTWFIWPFIFVYSFANAIAELVQDKEDSGKSMLIAAFSLLVILAGVTGTHFG